MAQTHLASLAFLLMLGIIIMRTLSQLSKVRQMTHDVTSIKNMLLTQLGDFLYNSQSHLINTYFLKVNKFQNENMKSSHCPKYEQKNLKNSAQSVQGRNFQIFRSYFGQREDSIFSFWNFLTFSCHLLAEIRAICGTWYTSIFF